LSGTSSTIRTKLWWNSHWMVLFQNCVRQLHSPAKMAATVQLRCYWKQLWSRWAITVSWEPLVQLYYGENKYIFSAISWWEQVTICQLYHGENKLQFVSYIMARTSYIFSAILWREQVHFFCYIMVRTSYNEMMFALY
jgi:hypothetical protein